jgi:hypothetical protein
MRQTVWFVCGEQVDMYQGMSEFLRKHTTNGPLSIVNIVSGDGFFDPKTIQSLGFVNVTYVMDRWHLRGSKLEKSLDREHIDCSKVIYTDS